jgi:predicted oxidoreductase
LEKLKITEDLELSNITYGFMNASGWNLSSKELLDHIKSVLDTGISTFDHADIYGGYVCEKLFGDAMAHDPGLRNKIEVVTKCGIQLVTDNRPDTYIKHYNSTREHVIFSAESSLRNLQTDVIDLLLFHRPDPLMHYEGIADAFHQLNKDGKVRYFGVSNFSPQQFSTLQSYLNGKLVTNQIEISTYCLDAFFDGNLDFAMEKRIHPMAWSPLAGGALFSPQDQKAIRIKEVADRFVKEGMAKSVDQILLAWLLQHPAGIIPVIGTGKIDRVRSAVDSLKVEMSRQQWFELYTASLGADVP